MTEWYNNSMNLVKHNTREWLLIDEDSLELYHTSWGYPSKIKIQTNKRGYKQFVTRYNGNVINLTEHRVIYEHFNGIIPEGMVIDHIDGNPGNNSIKNLQSITQSRNIMKGRLTKKNTTGVRGVSFEKERKRYIAEGKIDGVYYRIGHFYDLESAAKARKEWEEKYI
jgi:hypothetical protein